MGQIFSLLDCNNFYVSCERLFNPRLAGRPVVVLSNNDGCIIARSNEAKKLGIGMGEPFFRCRRLIEAHRVEVFSSNFPLYGDISRRVMELLGQLEAEVEIYSIDEAFIRLPDSNPAELLANGRRIRAAIGRQVGIPVSIGFGPTKTLAKIANRIAKKEPEHEGVVLLPEQGLDDLLDTVAVSDIWGIGPHSAARLATRGIRTALALKNADDDWLRRHLGITGLRVAMELRAVSCLPLVSVPPAGKSIASSRSFGRPVTAFSDLREALCSYVSLAAEKLRDQRQKSGALQVYLADNLFSADHGRQVDGMAVNLPQPTSDTPELISRAAAVLNRLYRPGHSYRKVGVVLLDLSPADQTQPNLFQPPQREREELMDALDRINRRWGRDTIHSAANGLAKNWKNKQARKSPAYTTSWHELPVVI